MGWNAKSLKLYPPRLSIWLGCRCYVIILALPPLLASNLREKYYQITSHCDKFMGKVVGKAIYEMFLLEAGLQWMQRMQARLEICWVSLDFTGLWGSGGVTYSRGAGQDRSRISRGGLDLNLPQIQPPC